MGKDIALRIKRLQELANDAKRAEEDARKQKNVGLADYFLKAYFDYQERIQQLERENDNR